jgi:hypothetical protein
LQIPPQSKDFSHTSICYPACSERYFPADGITVLSGFLHTHLAGRAVKTTLVQNGVATRELFSNPNYDFNYQFVIDIEPIKLRKGDALITECRYETNDRNNFTFFGFSTYDEMCYDFVYYYPKIPTLTQCITQTPNTVLLAFYQSLMKLDLFKLIFKLFISNVFLKRRPSTNCTNITSNDRIRNHKFFSDSSYSIKSINRKI